MSAMPHYALAELSSDPRAGVISAMRSVQIILKYEDKNDIKKAVLRLIDENLYKYYPDAGGIILGYQSVKIKQRGSIDVGTLFPVNINIKAKFYLFNPQVGAELSCQVVSKEADQIKCLVHNKFEVSVFQPNGCCDVVYLGQVVVVEVEAVMQQAWQNPTIIATLVKPKVINEEDEPLIDFVENFDSDEFEIATTDSGVFESEKCDNNDNKGGKCQDSHDCESSETDNESANCDMTSNVAATKKRKIQDMVPTSDLNNRPKKKKNNHKALSIASESSTAPAASKETLKQTDLMNNQVSSSSKHTLSASTPNTPQVSVVPPKILSTAATSSSSKPSPTKHLSRILPLPTSPVGANLVNKAIASSANNKKKADISSSESNSSDDETDVLNKSSQNLIDPKVTGISETSPDTVEPNLLRIEALVQSPAAHATTKCPEKITNTREKMTTQKKGKSGCPPGFTLVLTKSGKPRLTAPDGTKFVTYKAAWEYVETTIKTEPVLPPASTSNSPSADSEKESPADQIEPVEVTPISKNSLSKQEILKQSKKSKDTPTQEAKPANQQVLGVQKLVVDQPSFTESEPDNQKQAQNIPIQESDTEYQSQSLLVSPSKQSKKILKAGELSSSLEGKTKNRKSPLKNNSVGGFKNHEVSLELQKPVNELKKGVAVSPSKVSPAPLNTNVDASRTSSNSSSEDSSSEDEAPTQKEPVVPEKQKIVPTRDESSSSDSDSEEDTVVPPKVSARPSTSVNAKSSSSDSDSDSSGYMEEEKVTEGVKATVPTKPEKSAAAIKESVTAQSGSSGSKGDLKSDSSSNESSSGDEYVPNKPVELPKKKFSKNSNSSKTKATSEIPTTNSNTENPKTKSNSSGDIMKPISKLSSLKSPHLSSTVMSGDSKKKGNQVVPDGISPIQPRQKVKNTGKSFYDDVMETSTLGYRNSDKPSVLDSSKSKPNSTPNDSGNSKGGKNKKKKKVAGFM